MARDKQKTQISKSFDYTDMLSAVLDTGDPFSFLTSLKQTKGDAFDPSVVSGGRTSSSVSTSALSDIIHQEANIADMVRKIVNENAMLPRDTKIDDSGLPLAKNIYEWVTKDSFAGTVMTPFVEQLIWGIILFGEFCVAEGSYIHSSNGLMRVEDLVGNPTQVGMPDLRIKVATDSGVKYTSHGGLTSKRRKCLKITYANGHSITVTPEHRVQVLKSDLSQAWVEAKDLHIDSFGVMPNGTNIWPRSPAKLKPGFEFLTHIDIAYPNGTHATAQLNHSKKFKPLEKVTPELSRLTGYLISDGSIGKNGVSFVNLERNLVEDFVRCCNSVFGYSPEIKTGEKYNSTQPYYTASLHGREIVKYLRHIGFTGRKSYDKVIPDYILQSDKQTVIACLRAIFDCDGYIDSNRIGITLASSECVEQIHLLLQNLGVYGVYKKYHQDTSRNPSVAHRELDDYRNHRGEWVTKNSKSIEIYADIIGSKHEAKQENLCSEKITEAFTVSRTGNVKPGAIPYAKELYAHAKTLRDGYHDKGLCYLKFGRRTFAMIDDMLGSEEFVSFFQRKDSKLLRRLKELKTANYAFSKIVKIEDAGFHKVYDLTVPSVENFLCNGVVVHNCPRCSDVEWLYEDHKATDTYDTLEKHVCLLENGVCPSCKGRKSEFVASGEMFFYQELAVCAGQRSGKSATTGGILTPYMTHRILKMQKPAEIYGISGSTMLHGTFCALTYAQAKETLWEFYYGTLMDSMWFREYHSMLKHYEDVYGQQLFKFNDTFVMYRCRNLMWYPAGPDKRVLRGRTRIFAGVDEIGYFDNDPTSKKIKVSANGVYEALDSSLLTVRGAAERLIRSGYDDVLTGMAMNVSSPSSRRDKIMQLVRLAQTSEVIYGIHRPTWEVNPTLPRDSKVITERYRTDPAGAARDFGAEPPLSANAFIENKEAVAACIGTKRNPIEIKHKRRSGTSTRQAAMWATIKNIKRSKRPTILTIDAGYSNNSFALAVGRVDSNTSMITVDMLVEIMPEPGYPLNYTKIYDEIICPIIEARNVKVFLADRWNSLKLLSDAEASYGILSKQYSLKYKDLWLSKTLIEQEELVLPRLSDKRMTVSECLEFPQDEYPDCFKNKEVDHMIVQMLTVQDTGTQVTKGDGLTDDLWRATALLCWALENPDFEEYLMLDPGDEEEKFRPQALGCSKLGSGGGSSNGSGSGLSMNGQLGMWRQAR